MSEPYRVEKSRLITGKIGTVPYGCLRVRSKRVLREGEVIQVQDAKERRVWKTCRILSINHEINHIQMELL